MVKILTSGGATAAWYEYDAWGNVVSIGGNASIANINPIRYRGYYYDAETGFYYLNSRYYDPEICRFVNVDSLLDSNSISNGLNMFAYCKNNPCNLDDPTGEIAITTCILIGSAIIGTLAFTCTAVSSYERTGQVDWVGSLMTGLSWGLTTYTCGMSLYGTYCDYSYASGTTPVTNIGTSKATVVYPPNNGFNSTPRDSLLMPGSKLQRTGGINGIFVAPINTPTPSLSLPPHKIGAPIINIQVLQPINVQAGTAMPWFNQPGGGTQFLLPASIGELQAQGIIRILP